MNDASHHLDALSAIAARAVAAAGGSARLGRELGLKRSTVHGWKTNRVPAERVAAVSRLTGIPLHELRPDLFDAPPQPEAA